MPDLFAERTDRRTLSVRIAVAAAVMVGLGMIR